MVFQLLVCAAIAALASPSWALTYQWTESSGPVADYVVVASWNGGDYRIVGIVRPADGVPLGIEISGQPGDVVVVRVVVRNSAGIQGPWSDFSDPFTFPDAKSGTVPETQAELPSTP